MKRSRSHICSTYRANTVVVVPVWVPRICFTPADVRPTISPAPVHLESYTRNRHGARKDQGPKKQCMDWKILERTRSKDLRDVDKDTPIRRKETLNIPWNISSCQHLVRGNQPFGIIHVQKHTYNSQVRTHHHIPRVKSRPPSRALITLTPPPPPPHLPTSPSNSPPALCSQQTETWSWTPESPSGPPSSSSKAASSWPRNAGPCSCRHAPASCSAMSWVGSKGFFCMSVW